MITIYELLEVEEDASKEEIEKAYSRLVLEFRQDIKFDDAKNKENELIINRLKLAYEILMDDEKRKKYDYQLAQKRAENLIEKVVVQDEINKEVKNEDSHTYSNQQIGNNQNNVENIEKENFTESDILTEEEKNKINEAAQNEFQQNLKKAQKAEEEYKKAYNKAYNDYLRKNGYRVNEVSIFKKIKISIIVILIFIVMCFILWHIPAVKNSLINLYEENFVIKILVDGVSNIINSTKK